MEKSTKYLLVPWDFTSVSDNALQHALRIAKYVNNEVRLIHIIDDNSKAGQMKEEAEGKLDLLVKEVKEKHGIKPSYVILEGSIFNTISKYASSNDVQMVIMGTHGVKGMQKLTGSWALKVMLGSKVPFLIVQDKPTDKKRFTDIVFPIDFKAESREKLYWAIYLGKYFSSKIHLFKPPTSDQAFLKGINTNLNFAIKFLKQNDIEYEIHTAKKASNFPKEIITLSEEIEADLILIMTTKNVTIGDFVLGVPEQYVITNSAKLPVMCVNPREGAASVHQVMF
jgi:nucleotide-binding universal stress UspA family protein